MQISPPRYRTIAVAAWMALAVIIVTGAAVRLTGSGLGCDDWPRCSQERFVDVSSGHRAIEQLNRLFTGVVGVAVIVAVLASWWRTPRRRDLTRLAWWLVVGVLANAVLGGISVKVDLHPLAVQSHMLLSMFLIVVATILVHRAGEPDGAVRVPAVGSGARRVVTLHFVASCAAVFTGTLVTGAGPHAGDEHAKRLDVAITTIARVHGITVMVTIAIAVALAAYLNSRADERRVLQPPLALWIVIGIAQAALGYIQYLSDIPAGLVALHIVGAIAVMWASTRLLLAVNTV